MGAYLPGILVLFAVVPPGFFEVELLYINGFGFIVVLHAIRVRMFEIPDDPLPASPFWAYR